MDWNDFFLFLQKHCSSIVTLNEFEIFNCYSETHWVPNISKEELKKAIEIISQFKKNSNELQSLLKEVKHGGN